MPDFFFPEGRSSFRAELSAHTLLWWLRWWGVSDQCKKVTKPFSSVPPSHFLFTNGMGRNSWAPADISELSRPRGTRREILSHSTHFHPSPSREQVMRGSWIGPQWRFSGRREVIHWPRGPWCTWEQVGSFFSISHHQVKWELMLIPIYCYYCCCYRYEHKLQGNRERAVGHPAAAVDVFDFLPPLNTIFSVTDWHCIMLLSKFQGAFLNSFIYLFGEPGQIRRW